MFRWSWFATRLHVFLLLIEVQAGDDLRLLCDTACRHARRSKGGLPVGLQTGCAVVPILVGPVTQADLGWAGLGRCNALVTASAWRR